MEIEIEIEYTPIKVYCKCCDRELEEYKAQDNKIHWINVLDIMQSIEIDISYEDHSVHAEDLINYLESYIYEDISCKYSYDEYKFEVSEFHQAKVLVFVYKKFTEEGFEVINKEYLEKKLADMLQNK